MKDERMGRGKERREEGRQAGSLQRFYFLRFHIKAAWGDSGLFISIFNDKRDV